MNGMPTVVEQRPRRNTWVFWLLGCFGVIVCMCCALPIGGVVMVGTLAAISERNAVVETETQTLPLTSGDTITLVVDGNVGDVTIVGEAGVEEITVQITRKGKGLTKDQARAALDEIEVALEQKDERYTVQVKGTEGSEGFNFLKSGEADVRITVPTRLNIEAETNVGELKVRNIETVNMLKLQVDVGSIDFDGVLGPSGTHEMTVNVGDIDLHLQAGSGFQLDADIDVGDFSDKTRFGTFSTQGDGPSDHAEGRYSWDNETEGNATLVLTVDVGSIDVDD